MSSLNSDDIELIKAIKRSLKNGLVLSYDTRLIWNKVETYIKEKNKQKNSIDPIIILNIFKENISSNILNAKVNLTNNQEQNRKKIILSLELL